MRTCTTYESHAKTSSIKSNQNPKSSVCLRPCLAFTITYYFICKSCRRTRTQLAITKNKHIQCHEDKTCRSCINVSKNAQFAKSDCTVIKNEYLLKIDHPFRKEKSSVSFTRINQLENLEKNKKRAPKLPCTFSFVPYYFQTFIRNFFYFKRGDS